MLCVATGLLQESDHWLALAIAVTGILATVPYIALQLIGIQVSVGALGLSGGGWTGQLPLVIAFALLLGYTYTGGLRAPASIAFIKDVMIYIVVLAAIIWLPLKLGGYGNIFHSAATVLASRPNPASLVLRPGQYLPFSTLVLGSSLALFLYPHSITAVLSSSSAAVIKRNSALMPAYSLLLGMLALLGYGALAAGVSVTSSSYVVPALFVKTASNVFGMSARTGGHANTIPEPPGDEGRLPAAPETDERARERPENGMGDRDEGERQLAAAVADRPRRVAKMARPIDPPICRRSELRPVASVSLWRGMRESATVVSGTNRQLKPTPCTSSAWMICAFPDCSV